MGITSEMVVGQADEGIKDGDAVVANDSGVEGRGDEVLCACGEEEVILGSESKIS